MLSKGEGVLGGKDSAGRAQEIAQAKTLLGNLDKLNAAIAASTKTMQTFASANSVKSNAPATSIGQRSAM